MKTSGRLEQAITKLYTAFHNDTLHPECCKSCAVGNILDNSDAWRHLSDNHGSLVLNYVGRVNEGFGRRINGYTPSELLKIEAVFLEGCGYNLPLGRKSKRPKDPTSKEVLFNGLNAAVSFLCYLDGIDDVMDYSKLFEFENNQPVYELAQMPNF
ncbi:MAG: Na(+)-translocating NADH-quinone reductase subunit F [Leeuwenhoekiella sp.]